jgi:PASTA domain
VAFAVALSASLCGGCTTAGHHSAAPNVKVPYLGPQESLKDYEAELCAAGLVPRIVAAPAILGAGTEVNGFYLMGASPAGGARVHAGSTVDLRLGQSDNAGGLDPHAADHSVVPNVVAMDANEALGVLTHLGFSVDATVDTPTARTAIVEQSPAAGANLTKGATVTLTAGGDGNSC